MSYEIKNIGEVVPISIYCYKVASSRTKAELAVEINELLSKEYPGTTQQLCALGHKNPFELLVATILSAQCTDKRVNEVTPHVFSAYGTPVKLAAANPEDLEKLIRPTGFFRNKAKNLIAMSKELVEHFDGEVPSKMESLATLPGVGRKTANVVLSVCFNVPGLPVDTHVGRLSRRLGLSDKKDPEKVEAELNVLVPPEQRGVFSLRLILHGRKVCKSRSALCEECVLNFLCPSSCV